MAEDVKTLREAADRIKRKLYLPDDMFSGALEVMFSRMADMIEREGAHDPYTRGYLDGESDAKKAPTPDALQAAEDRGWNAALEAAVKQLSKNRMASVNSPFAEAIRSLRREPSK